jgi:predicted PhzF superfamily epimerase YddE/YHI9
LSDTAALRRAAPSRAALGALLEPLGALLEPLGVLLLYLVAVEVEADSPSARGFFVDPTAITEDPATGSPAGPLLAYLRARAGTTALTVRQGAEIGRTSTSTAPSTPVAVGGLPSSSSSRTRPGSGLCPRP